MGPHGANPLQGSIYNHGQAMATPATKARPDARSSSWCALACACSSTDGSGSSPTLLHASYKIKHFLDTLHPDGLVVACAKDVRGVKRTEQRWSKRLKRRFRLCVGFHP